MSDIDTEYDAFLARGHQWRELLPEGRYAWPLYDWESPAESEPPIIGYCIYWKRRKGGMSVHLRLAESVEPTPESQQRLRTAHEADENSDREYHLAAIVDKPEEYAGAYGMFSGKCGFCGRKLTDPESVERGIGPDCLGKLAVAQ